MTASDGSPHRPAAVIDGAAIAAGLRQHIAAAVERLRREHGVTPGLAAVLVGDDPASHIYVRSKARACTAAGIASFEHRLPADSNTSAILDLVARLNADDRVDGILVQLPLPPGIEQRAVIAALDPAKDVDGFHPVNVGRLVQNRESLVACTPSGVIELLERSNIPMAGAEAVVIGRSDIVG